MLVAEKGRDVLQEDARRRGGAPFRRMLVEETGHLAGGYLGKGRGTLLEDARGAFPGKRRIDFETPPVRVTSIAISPLSLSVTSSVGKRFGRLR